MTEIISLATSYQLPATRDITKITVLVTGVFDILHREHQKFLKAAKKQGNILIVGVECDQRVSQLKGKGRPLNPLKTRLANLANLQLADYAFELPPNLDTKQGREILIKKIKPHILAVSQSTPNLAEKHRIMKLVGGTVKVVLSHNPKISSSKIVSSTWSH